MRTFIAALVALSSAAIQAAWLPERPEPNAFLNRPAHTTGQLVEQAKSDPEVMSRFMRLWQMDRSAVIAYLSTLKLVRLKQEGYFTLYNAPANAPFGARVFRVPAGSLMWADPEGNLVLKKSCGNPLTTGPRSLSRNPKGNVETALLPRKFQETAPQPGDQEPLALMPAAEVLAPTFVPTSLPEANTLPPQPPPVETISSGGGSFPWPLLGLPLLLLGGGTGGGGGTSGGDTGGTTGGTTGGGEVPGPAAAIVFILVPAIRRALRR